MPTRESRRLRHALLTAGVLSTVSAASCSPAAPPDSPWKHPRTTTMSTASQEPDDDATLRKLADDYVAAVNRDDRTAITELTCAHQAPSMLQMAADGERVRAGEISHTHDPNVVRATVIIGDWSGPLWLENHDGTWCVRD